MSAEQKLETTEQPVQEKSEGEVVLDLLRAFQENLKIANEKNEALEAEIKLLSVKVNKELPAQLDSAFKDIHDNFVAITKAFETMPHTQQSTLGAVAAKQEEGGFLGMLEKIVNGVFGEEKAGSAGTMSEFDKEILKTTKQIQMITLKDVLKRTAKSAGIDIAEHVVVNG